MKTGKSSISLNSLYEKIYTSSLKLLSHKNLEDLYATIVREAKKLIRARHGTILIVENDELKRVYASSQFFYRIRPRKRGYTYRAYKNQRPYLISRENSVKLHPELINHNIGSDIGTPLIYNKKTIGVMCFFSPEKKEFTKDDLAVLRIYSKAVALIMKNMQRYEYTQKALDERDLFISMAAHELKTPLTTVSIYSQLLLRKDTETKYSDTQIKMKLSNEIRRLTNLVNELLQVNQIKSGTLQFAFKKCDLCSVVEGAVTSFENIYINHPVHFKNELKNRYCYINGDFDKLFQVITNLLNNAAKFSPEYSPIDIVLKYEDSRYVLSVTDYGPGIRKKDLSRIFERFYKGNKQEKDGLGLGLYLVKNVIDKHEGSITVSSKLKKGTTFTITLPMYTNGEIQQVQKTPLIINATQQSNQ